MASLPDKLLLRRSEVRSGLGITRYEMQKLVIDNKLIPFKLRPGGRAYFKRKDVLQLLNKEPAE